MRVRIKRLLLSIVGGTLLQVGVCLLAVIINKWQMALLAGLLLLPGWIVSQYSEQIWPGYIINWLVLLAVNNLFYGSGIYILLWCRDVQKEIRDKDLDSFIREPHNANAPMK